MIIKFLFLLVLFYNSFMQSIEDTAAALGQIIRMFLWGQQLQPSPTCPLNSIIAICDHAFHITLLFNIGTGFYDFFFTFLFYIGYEMLQQQVGKMNAEILSWQLSKAVK